MKLMKNIFVAVSSVLTVVSVNANIQNDVVIPDVIHINNKSTGTIVIGGVSAMKKIQLLLLSISLYASSESLIFGSEIGLTFDIKHKKEFKASSYEIKIPLDMLTVYGIAAEIDIILALNTYPEFHGIDVKKMCTGISCIPYEYHIYLDTDPAYINLDQAKAAIAKAIEKKIGEKVRWYPEAI